MYNCKAASLTLWKSEVMVCWKGDPSSRSGAFGDAPLTFCELSEGTLQTKIQVLADKSDKPWKINTWHGRTATYLAMGAHSATPLIRGNFNVGSGKPASIPPHPVRVWNQTPPATPSLERSNGTLCIIETEHGGTYGEPKIGGFYMSRISTAKQKKWFNDHPKHAWRWKNRQTSSSSRHLRGECKSSRLLKCQLQPARILVHETGGKKSLTSRGKDQSL